MFKFSFFLFKVNFLSLWSPTSFSSSSFSLIIPSMIELKELIILSFICEFRWIGAKLIKLWGDITLFFEIRPYLWNMKINEIRIISINLLKFFRGECFCINIMLNVNMFMVKNNIWMLSFWNSRSIKAIKSLIVFNFLFIVFVEEWFLLLDIFLCFFC